MLWLGVVIVGVVVGADFARKRIIFTDNIGNVLCSYVMRWHAYGNSFRPIIRSKNKILQRLPKHPGNVKRTQPRITNIINNTFNPNGWTTVEGHKVFKDMHQPLRCILDRVVDRCEVEVDIIVHFRCSDSPFNRHPHYSFLKYRWYFRAIDEVSRRLGVKNPTVGILFWPYHRAFKKEINAAECYYSLLKRELSKRYTVPEIGSVSVEQDFSRMYHARGLVCATSSMSFMAGVASKGVCVFPSDSPVVIRDNFVMLPPDNLQHSEVKDYYDVKTVHKQLKSDGEV